MGGFPDRILQLEIINYKQNGNNFISFFPPKYKGNRFIKF